MASENSALAHLKFPNLACHISLVSAPQFPFRVVSTWKEDTAFTVSIRCLIISASIINSICSEAASVKYNIST